jgi:hypothetical protein
MKSFDPCLLLFRQTRCLPAEVVHVLQLTEKLRDIIHAIHAELECGDMMTVDADLDLFPRHVGALAGYGEISGLVVIVCHERNG